MLETEDIQYEELRFSLRRALIMVSETKGVSDS